MHKLDIITHIEFHLKLSRCEPELYPNYEGVTRLVSSGTHRTFALVLLELKGGHQPDQGEALLEAEDRRWAARAKARLPTRFALCPGRRVIDRPKRKNDSGNIRSPAYCVVRVEHRGMRGKQLNGEPTSSWSRGGAKRMNSYECPVPTRAWSRSPHRSRNTPEGQLEDLANGTNSCELILRVGTPRTSRLAMRSDSYDRPIRLH
ncbi:hypothetical protein FGB62_514g01 [Gracilaria domingensis]|nr:hypothetical protein FGB62_514g01 [Gracilaria domingensis]